MAHAIFTEGEAHLIDSLIQAKDYSFEEDSVNKFWYLNYEGHAYTEVAFSYWDDTKSHTLSIGYMMN